MPSETPFRTSTAVPTIQQHQSDRTHPARCPFLAGSTFAHQPPARTFPTYFMAVRSGRTSRKHTRQTLVCTSVHVRTAKTGTHPRHRRRHIRSGNRLHTGRIRHIRYRIGRRQSRISRQRKPSRAALCQNLATRYRTNRTFAHRLRLHQTPARTHPAQLRHMGRKRHHPPQLQPRRIPSQSRIGVTKTPCTPLPQHHVCRSRKNRRYPPQRPLHRTIMRPLLAARRMAQSARIRPRPPQPSAD